MKKFLSVVAMFLLFCTVTACSQQVDTHPALTAVLNNEKIFITQSGDVVLLSDYMIDNTGQTEPVPARVDRYAFVDMDGDGNDELIANVSLEYGSWLVFRCDGMDVYGYSFVYRAILSLKTDGTHIESNGADNNRIIRMSFKDNRPNTEYIAVIDGTKGEYRINGRKTTLEKAKKYYAEWDRREAVQWILVQ